MGSFLSIVLALGVAAAVGVYFLAKFLKNVQPTTSEVDDDVKLMRKELDTWRGGFLSWSRDLLELVTLEEVGRTLQEGYVTKASGVFVTGSQEPVFAYSYKKYIAPGVNAVLYVLNSDHEFVFHMTNKGTDITVDGVKFGKIRKDSEFYDMAHKLMGRLSKSIGQGTEIVIGDQKMAQVPSINAKPITQLSNGLPEPANEQEVKVLQSLSVYSMAMEVLER